MNKKPIIGPIIVDKVKIINSTPINSNRNGVAPFVLTRFDISFSEPPHFMQFTFISFYKANVIVKRIFKSEARAPLLKSPI